MSRARCRQTRRWRKDGEDSDRFATEILLVPGGRIQFLDRATGNDAAAEAGATVNGSAVSDGDAQADDADRIPF